MSDMLNICALISHTHFGYSPAHLPNNIFIPTFLMPAAVTTAPLASFLSSTL